MKKLLAGLSVGAFALGLTFVGTSFAAGNSPVDGNTHPHHIHTGNGECNDAQQDMEGGARGLHRGANESGFEHGMWHGSCATHNNHG